MEQRRVGTEERRPPAGWSAGVPPARRPEDGGPAAETAALHRVAILRTAMLVALLSLFLLLFILRVLGQLLVVLAQPRWLPPMKDWYSGLIAYPFLLPAQIAIIVLMIVLIRHVASNAPPNRPLALGILAFATIYALSMVVRFVILRRRHPDYRWYEGGMIPILFHWVLAGFLFTYAAARL